MKELTAEERARVMAYLDCDPLVQQMREQERHVYVAREPATQPNPDEVLDPITAILCCPTCVPIAFAKTPLAQVIKADGVLICPSCAARLPVLREDLTELAALQRAIQDGDYTAYMRAVVTINQRSNPLRNYRPEMKGATT